MCVTFMFGHRIYRSFSHRRRRRGRGQCGGAGEVSVWWFVGVFTAGWSSARFGWRRVRSPTAVLTEPSPARSSSGESETRPGTRCAARRRARSCRSCGRNRWLGAPLPGTLAEKPLDWLPVGGPDRAAPFVRAAPGTLRSTSTSLNPRARLLEVRARGLGDVLAGYPTISWARPGAGPAGMGREPESGPRRPWGGEADSGWGRAEPGSGRAQVCMAAHTPRLAAPARGSGGQLA